MKKRIFSLILAVMLLALCGCDRLSMADNLPGSWRSEDGYTVVFTQSEMTLYDADGQLVDGFPAVYIMSGNILHVRIGDTLVEMFECRADGDMLTLIYTDSFLLSTIGSAEKTVSITLTRCGK